MQLSPLGQAALALAQAGLHVFPCNPDNRPGDDKWPKKPACEHGLKDATVDPAQITAWWTGSPNCNIAVRTGDRHWTLDTDVKDGGLESFARMVEKFGPLPETIEVATPSGGSHHWFANGLIEIRNSAKKLAPGMDVRGHGGYVLVPPSTVCGVPYEWRVTEPLAKAPQWLTQAAAAAGNVMDLNGADRQRRQGEDWIKIARDPVPEGQRNHTLASLAGKLFRHMPGDCALMVAELCHSWNLTRCSPPLPHDEVERTLNSIAAAEMRRRGL